MPLTHEGGCATFTSDNFNATIMAKDTATIDPRYLTYNKDEVQALLDKVNAENVATEESVRNIVTNYSTE